MVIIFKKNNKFCFCVDFRKFNTLTLKNHNLLSYIKNIIDEVTRHRIYSFLDSFLEYYEVSMAGANKNKTIFLIE